MSKNIQQKIKELEAKYKEQLKADKAKMMADYRAAKKKTEEAELKQFVRVCLEQRKLLNDDSLFFGCLRYGIHTVSKNDQQRLDYLRGLARNENNQA